MIDGFGQEGEEDSKQWRELVQRHMVYLKNSDWFSIFKKGC